MRQTRLTCKINKQLENVSIRERKYLYQSKAQILGEQMQTSNGVAHQWHRNPPEACKRDCPKETNPGHKKVKTLTITSKKKVPHEQQIRL